MRLRLPRAVTIPLAVLVGLVLLAVIASFFVDEPLRRHLEKQMNAKLTGYEVRLPRAHFSLIGLSVNLGDLTVRQRANPEPAVMVLPGLRASVQWSEVLRLKLVADVLFDRPKLHIDRSQVMTEAKDNVKVTERGWQEALEAIYPLKINMLTVENGEVTYIDDQKMPPLKLTKLQITANNIRNIRSQENVYPSPVRAEAVVFDRGRARIQGHANFLAEPYPGVHAVFELADLPLEPFHALVRRSNMHLDGGLLSTSGEAELAPTIKSVDVDKLSIRQLTVEYVHTPRQAAAERKAVIAVQKATAKAAAEPEIAMRLKKLELLDSRFVLKNAGEKPFRVYVDNADLVLDNLSSEFRDGPARARLTGRFMGSGKSEVVATFRPTTRGPDLDLKIAVGDTDLTRMNDLLRAYGNFDVVKGTFAYYSDLHVKNGVVTGYVKPLFRDLDVYDKRQDKEKSVFRKLYERIVGTLADLLENTPRDEVATKAEVVGRLEDPKTSTFQVVVRLIQNAFFRAILPGFDDEVSRVSKVRLGRKEPKPKGPVDLAAPPRRPSPQPPK